MKHALFCETMEPHTGFSGHALVKDNPGWDTCYSFAEQIMISIIFYDCLKLQVLCWFSSLPLLANNNAWGNFVFSGSYQNVRSGLRAHTHIRFHPVKVLSGEACSRLGRTFNSVNYRNGGINISTIISISSSRTEEPCPSACCPHARKDRMPAPITVKQ